MNTKQTFKFLALTLACVLCISSPAAAQTAPSLISFQGRLTDSLNNPLAGNYNFAFAIYAAQTGGSPLWSESQNGITVANGVLMAELGSGTPIQDSVFSAAQRYLEITVNGTTLAPRQRLLSVPYAMNAQTLGGKGYSALVSTDTAQVISGAKTFTADISMSGAARVTNLAAPAAPGDAATKAYVDTVAGGFQNSTLSSTQTFTGQNAFTNQVTISSDIYLSAGRINLQGNIVTTAGGLLDASKLANTVPNSSLDGSSVTKRGNAFNGAGQLVLLDSSGKLPGIDGSLLTNVAAGNVNAAGVLPGAFVSGVLLPAAQVQPGSLGSGVIVSSLAAGAVYPGSFQSGIYNIDILGNAGTVSNGVYATGSYYDPAWLTGLSTAKIDLSTVTAALALKATTSALTVGLAGKLSSAATVPAALIDLSTVTAALDGKLSSDVTIPPSIIDLSTVTTALDGKLSDSVSIPPALVDLSTVTIALALKATTSALTTGLAGKLSNTATVPATLINLSTVTTELAGKLSAAGDGSSLTGITAAQIGLGNVSNTAQLPASYLDTDPALAANSDVKVASQKAAKAYTDAALASKADTAALTSGLAGKLSNTATVPPALIDLSTVTSALAGKADDAAVASALAGKLSNSAAVPASLVDLSTVAAALAGKLSSLVSIPQSLVDLSTVTSALALKADSAAVLPNNATVPAGLVNLSTVTAALAGKLFTNGDGSALTNLTAANISSGNLGSSVVASSLAVNSVYTASIQDGALSFAKIGVNSCGPNEVLRRNLANTLWICGPDEGGVAGTFTLAPASPLSDVSANPSVYVNDTGGGNFLHFQDSGVDKFTVNNTGLITSGGIGAAQITAGTLPANVIASSIAINAVYPNSVQAGSYNINILGNAASVSNGIYSNASYSDPSWIASLSTSKIDLSTVTSALAAKADDGAVTSALAGKASYDDVRTDTTTIAGNMAAGLAARASLAGINTFTSSQTITDARGLYASRHMLGEGVEISSEASAAYGAGIRISSNVYIVGVSSATRYYGDGSNLTGIVATAKWVGYSATALNGNRSGYAGANAECSAAHSGAHVCTNAEILFTINSGLLGSNFPLNVSLWINNGPPGNTMNVNDCNGWVSSGGSEYGALWNRVAAGDGFGSIQPCSATAKYACCK